MIIVDNPSVFGNFRTRNFNEIYPDIEKFKEDFTEYSNVGLNPNFTNEQTIQTIYYLLSARYGNSTISNFDVNQFKMKLFSIIFQYGPTWEKNLDIQKNLRSLSDKELTEGSKQIFNHSYNPSAPPTTNTDEELPTINDQNVNKSKRSKLDAYSLLMTTLRRDVTEEFIVKFKNLFLVIVEPYSPLYYITGKEGEDIG